MVSKKQLELAKTKDQVDAVEKLAKDTFAFLPALAPVSKGRSEVLRLQDDFCKRGLAIQRQRWRSCAP